MYNESSHVGRGGKMSQGTHKGWILFNGRLVNSKEEQAIVPLEERGLQFGDGIYEVFRLYNGKPHLLDLHLDRFFKSMKEIDLNPPFTKEELIEQLQQLIEKINFKKMEMFIFKFQGAYNQEIMCMNQILSRLILQISYRFLDRFLL